jgi:hypothetical protein
MAESAFVKLCLSGLRNMYIGSEHVFSASLREVGSEMVNVRNAEQEYKYSMNTLMGLHRAQMNGTEVFVDVERDYVQLAPSVVKWHGSPENVAATTWTAACIGAKIPSAAKACFLKTFNDPPSLRGVTAQALAWAIAACVEMKAGRHGQALAHVAARWYVHPRTSLVRHSPASLRRDWASFAASCYMAYAFLRLGATEDDNWATDIGLRVSRALVSLQGPQGQWGWFYNVPRGSVADYYPVYSVHQHSMAPLFLLTAIDMGYGEFKEPLVRGFEWILGKNELARSMVDSSRHLVWRSVVRRRGAGVLTGLVRGVHLACRPRPAEIGEALELAVNRECRSYELGWGLWAFAGRADFGTVLNHQSLR